MASYQGRVTYKLEKAINNKNDDKFNKWLKEAPYGNLMDSKGFPLIAKTVANNYLHAFKALIKNGSKIDFRLNTTKGEFISCVVGAGYNDNVEMVKILLKRGANVNNQDSLGRTPLHILFGDIATGNMNMCDLLLNNGANYELTDINGKTPLDFAKNSLCVSKLNLMCFEQRIKEIQSKKQK